MILLEPQTVYRMISDKSDIKQKKKERKKKQYKKKLKRTDFDRNVKKKSPETAFRLKTLAPKPDEWRDGGRSVYKTQCNTKTKKAKRQKECNNIRPHHHQPIEKLTSIKQMALEKTVKPGTVKKRKQNINQQKEK
ncbi:unnamed protein product [Arabidopsis thaliana]|uniref:Uncharacterized protein n=3 Tax=Arabidopsis TaxID=3701 RepID=A0A654EWL9_ARATH|nr:uncharacterized protein AT2G22088 [Arabidopsis thaliana]AEC07263.1 hypothetical protein AT2G22088 [Arabidopsis thaliana]KAG7637021.1 hypothetical protein ISN45_At02g015910 [Arabidopsis thaliana x Arabidopsis arenosa]CAA0369208.1 unnamed protein product [Arabidopsis thaliana]VYS53128.1 unnamed protein product [Arabidopsis thaliana]|eukprot:NP_001154527.1 hypothetical protein AT2G22088 [Arabidopsis thaliana]